MLLSAARVVFRMILEQRMLHDLNLESVSVFKHGLFVGCVGCLLAVGGQDRAAK